MTKSHLSLGLAALFAAACGSSSGPYHAPPPKSSVPMPTGSALLPWDMNTATDPRPTSIVLTSEDHLYVTLNNLITSKPPNLPPGGPGLLVAMRPSLGASSETVIDLGGSSQHDCIDSGALKQDGSKLYVACTGILYSSDTRGRAVVEVDTTANAVTRTAVAPGAFQPAGLAVTPSLIWVGDSNSPGLFAIDRTTFAVVAGNDPAHPIAACTVGPTDFAQVPALAYIGGDLFAICSSGDSQLVRLDATTGAVKDHVAVGAYSVQLALTGDGRIAVSNSVSGTVSLVQLGATMSVQKDASGKDLLVFAGTADVEGLAARDNFLYTVTAATANVQKWDLAQMPPKLLAEVSTGDHSSPLSILPLDDDQVVVSDQNLGTVLGIDFSKAHAP